MSQIELAGAPGEHLATILAIGKFGKIAVEWSEEKFVPTTEQLVQIQKRWAPKAAKGYFPGPVARVTGFEVEGDLFRLKMQPTTFSEFVGLQTDDDALRYGIGNLANPLSVSMAVYTADNKWLLTKKKRGDRIGSFDAVGGYLIPQKDENDPLKTAAREYVEETGVSEESAKQLVLLALQYEFKNLCHPVLSVLVETRLTCSEILELAPRKGDGEITLLAAEDPVWTMKELEQQGAEVEPDGQLTFALAMAYLSDTTIFENPMVCAGLDDSSLKLNLMVADVESRIDSDRVKFDKK